MNFEITYDTKGTEFGLIGSIPEMGEWQEGKQINLIWSNGNIWRGKVKIVANEKKTINYKFIQLVNGKITRWEDVQHTLEIDSSFKSHNLLLLERWMVKKKKFQRNFIQINTIKKNKIKNKFTG